jgi:N-dimethylarginine dimethylaminohydrolase
MIASQRAGPQTLMIGRSYRTNAEGVAQMRTIMAAEGVTVRSVDLPCLTQPLLRAG